MPNPPSTYKQQLPYLTARIVTKLARIGTNRRLHQKLATSLVTNNDPLTRKIRFVTAPTPPLELVTNMKMHQELVTSLSRIMASSRVKYVS